MSSTNCTYSLSQQKETQLQQYRQPKHASKITKPSLWRSFHYCILSSAYSEVFAESNTVSPAYHGTCVGTISNKKCATMTRKSCLFVYKFLYFCFLQHKTYNLRIRNGRRKLGDWRAHGPQPKSNVR
jgi:hypothetical protein